MRSATGRTRAAAAAPADRLRIGGRRRSTQISGSMLSAQTMPTPMWVAPSGRAKCCSTGADRAGDVVAAGDDGDRDPAPAHEPLRGIGDQRPEGGGADADEQAVREREQNERSGKPGGHAEAERPPAEQGHDHAAPIGEPPHQDAAEEPNPPSPAQGSEASARATPKSACTAAAPPAPTTCRRCRRCRAWSPRQAAAGRRRSSSPLRSREPRQARKCWNGHPPPGDTGRRGRSRAPISCQACAGGSVADRRFAAGSQARLKNSLNQWR